jgi:Ca2+-binding EF-hand superfamily protein
VQEFSDMLERIGFQIGLEKIYEIMKNIDENFDGRISYKELAAYIRTLGIQVDDLFDRQKGEKGG